MSIRLFQDENLLDAIAIFRDAVWNIASKDYTDEQCRAWAGDRQANSSTVEERQRFQHMLSRGMTLVAEDQQGAVAFGQLDPADHINLLYCCARGKGQGFATQILTALEAEAVRQQVEALHTEASLTARGFFEKQGYIVIEQEEVTRRGVQLSRFKMRKLLNG